MSRKKRVIWLNSVHGRVFASIDDAAAYFGTTHQSLMESIRKKRKYKGNALVIEGADYVPRDAIIGNPSKGRPDVHPNRKPIAEFREGELFCIYPSIKAASVGMGLTKSRVQHILRGRLKNNTGKDFAPATPLDECLIEIRERNKRPYQ